MSHPNNFGTHFMEVRAIASPEVPVSDILSHLFFRVHGALVSIGCSDVAVSFPEMRGMNLGAVLRVHGPEDVLKRIRGQDDRSRASIFYRLTDYIVPYPVRPVPADVSEFRSFFRVRPKGVYSPSRERRSLARSQKFGRENVAEALAVSEPNYPALFITTVSGGGKKFPFFIGHSPVYKTFVSGEFTSYGLAASVSDGQKLARVPWFPSLV